jgi:formylglycine-generating enzyme required for sulfatase activity
MKALYLALLLLSIAALSAQTLTQQGFEASGDDTWAYTADPAGMNRLVWWGRSDQIMGGAGAHGGSWYWASWDLDNQQHSLSFDPISLTPGYIHSLSFWYYSNGLNPATDEFKLCVAYDAGTEWTDWVTLAADTDAWTQITIDIPAYATTVRLKLAAAYDGFAKYAHWDDITLTNTPAPPTAPMVYNTSAAQRVDGSKIVDIYYDLFDANQDLCTVSLALSTDGGLSYAFTPEPANLSGDVGEGIANGPGKHIIWNAGAEGISFCSNLYAIEVYVEDHTTDTVATPVMNPAGGTYWSEQYIYISCDTPDAVIYYTVDGNDPDPDQNSLIYTGVPIIVNMYTTMTIRAKAFRNGWIPSGIASETYIVSGTVATPVFDPPGCAFSEPITVVISCATPQAQIWYTTDGSDPSVGNYYIYTTPLSIEGPMTIKALAFRADLTPSPIVTENYELVVSTPVFDPPGGTFSDPVNVVISCATTGAVIYYTTDGSNPTPANGVFYTAPIYIFSSTSFKAIAYLNGTSSEIVTSDYIIATTLILVEGGTFNNGTSDVTISSFYIGKYELTQAEYQAVMGVNPSIFTGVTNGPVEQVTWFNAIEYCNRRSLQETLTPCYSYSTYGTNPDNWPAGWNTSNVNHTNISCNWTANGYRLPTEMEWMFAAKGGNQSQGYTYSGSNDVDIVSWHSGNTGYTTHTIGTKAPNELSTFDMSGNVWEWCWDIYGSYPSGPQTDPHGATNGSVRTARGGGFDHPAYYCTVSYRGYSNPTFSGNDGFRVCRSLENFVLVEGGTFNNGTSDVTISSFYIDKYELTQAGYQAVMGTNPTFNYGIGDKYPVYLVTWYDAIEYCNRRSIQEDLYPCYSYATYGTNPTDWPAEWNSNTSNHLNISCDWSANGYRLPTEMEWMFAAKGGNQSQGYLYSGSNNIFLVAWISDNSGYPNGSTHPVGTKNPNELGIYDMSGNVLEWVWDVWGSSPLGGTDPTGPLIGPGRVNRGGAWNSSAMFCTVSYRTYNNANYISSSCGFRVCKKMQ